MITKVDNILEVSAAISCLWVALFLICSAILCGSIGILLQSKEPKWLQTLTYALGYSTFWCVCFSPVAWFLGAKILIHY